MKKKKSFLDVFINVCTVLLGNRFVDPHYAGSLETEQRMIDAQKKKKGK